MDLHILGSRGIPANHSGFETFAEQLALYLVHRGHKVTVYCQLDSSEEAFTDVWQGVHRIGLPDGDGPWGTIRFDFRSAWMASKHKEATLLTLGYNTAVFSIIHRLRGVYHFMNMDGLEWKRQKWSRAERLWFAINEFCGARLANHLVADHPGIGEHLLRYVRQSKISVIPYGADALADREASAVEALGVEAGRYALVIARPEPENSVLEIVDAYAARARSYRLLILGRYKPATNPFHAEVMRRGEAAGVLFPGAIHDPAITEALRQHALIYIHGHQVGGTNPSLVASLAAGNAVVAHDNRFNRWVAGPEARFFASSGELAALLDAVEDGHLPLQQMRDGSLARHSEAFTNQEVLKAYEEMLLRTAIAETRWSKVQV